MLPRSERVRWLLVVAIACLALAALHTWWLAKFRDGYPLDVDEAGYTAFGLSYWLGLEFNGLEGWWDAIQAQGRFAPLVPAIASLTVYLHPGVMNGFAVLVGFSILLVFAIYGIGERLYGPRLAAFAALITATLPGTLLFTRSYVFALPTAALFASAVFALLRSDGLRSTRWAIACGVALGLMLLTRTMAVAYIPGLLLAGLLALWLRRDGDLGRRLTNLGLLVISGAGVAATWYAKNLGSVYEYLTSYGYGAQSQVYGAEHALISWGRLRAVGQETAIEDLYVPLAILAAFALIALAVVVVKRLRPATSRRDALQHILTSDAATVAIIVAGCYAALTSSQNGGRGFTLPMAVLIPPLAVLALRYYRRATTPAVVMIAVLAAVTLVSTSTIWAAASRELSVKPPLASEKLPILKGYLRTITEIRRQMPGPETKMTADDAAWLRADAEAARIMGRYYGPNGEPPVITFGSFSRVLNTNTVQVAEMVSKHRAFPFVQLRAEPDSVANYLDELTDPALPKATAVVTMSDETGHHDPLVTQAYVESAARKLGFRLDRTLPLPDGRELRFWTQPASG